MAQDQEEDMYLFQAGYEQTPGFAGQAFDDFLAPTPTGPEGDAASPGFLDPSDLAIKRENDDQTMRLMNNTKRRSPPSSDGSSSTSSAESVKIHMRNISETSTASRSVHDRRSDPWGSGINGVSMPSGDELFHDANMSGLTDTLDNDYEASNQQMASDFDFETAASTPSGFDSAPLPLPTAPAMQSFRPTTGYGGSVHTNHISSRLPAPQSQFYFGGSREASPLSAMLPTSQAPSPWTKHSPSSGLEETFNGITMNGDSPGNATFSPNLQYSSTAFSFDPDSSSTPSTFTKDISSPPSTLNSVDGSPQLTVYPTSLKSRVETQIPIRMNLFPLPAGVRKLRLPTHTVSKPKFLAKAEAEKSPEILELYTSLVCTSAMQDPVRMERAFARARGEELAPLGRPSPASSIGSHSSRDDEDKPLNGGEVRICTGCIQRERKRASRKKQKKPDEEELFQKDEEKRVVVFNTNEIKDWVEPSKDSLSGVPTPTNGFPAMLPQGTMQVELPMRIACYCRHQNEKLGFQVIFTIKDHRDKVIAQAMTNSIMITDDHKTHNAPPSMPISAVPLPSAPQLPGAGVFSTSGMEMAHPTPANPKSFKQSFSTTDLHGLQHNFNPNFPMANAHHPFAIPSAPSTGTSATLTPRNLSRPASPNGPTGPTTKRRKQSGSGKLPSTLTMTRLETSQMPTGASTLPNTAASSPFAPHMSTFMSTADRGFAMPVNRPPPFGTSPPTPNGLENGFMSSINRSFSLENLPRQAIISAPSSRQPSRPSSPGSNRPSFGASDPNFGQIVSNQLLGQISRRPTPAIHKIVPAEGPIEGGTEVTLLGNGFYQGLEVMFGDTEATTTTFWGEKCLNCITPPALQPGMVTVLFKHEHPQYAQVQPHSQSRHTFFTYIDDREMELYRLALSTLGKQMPHPTDDPGAAARQLLNTGGAMQTPWPGQGSYGGGGGQQRRGAPVDLLELESNMLLVLKYMDLTGSSADPSSFERRRPTGSTLLHLGASLGLSRLVAGLLSREVNPNCLDNNGNTPMHHAAMNGHTQIIHRLRLAGADHKIRSIRNFVPADLATSLLAHQAAFMPGQQHSRSRSAGVTPMRLQSRHNSSTSLGSFWDQSASSSIYSDEVNSSDADDHPSNQPATKTSRRASHELNNSSAIDDLRASANDVERASSPAAYMMAWRDSLAAQINQFQESAQWTMPNLPTLPNLPALPAIPHYHTYPVVRRVSSLFPQRPITRQRSPSNKEGWWESLTGSTSPQIPAAPPSYQDLYPNQDDAQVDYSLKKYSAIQAAADAAADLHFGGEVRQESSRYPQDATQPGHAAGAERRIQKVELSRDSKLFFIWIPLLALSLALMLRSTFPDIWLALYRVLQSVEQRINGSAVEVA